LLQIDHRTIPVAAIADSAEENLTPYYLDDRMIRKLAVNVSKAITGWTT